MTGSVNAVIVNAKEEIPAEICILAPGHSARDTFAMLDKHNINMEPKSFAVGVRVEHPQTMINRDLTENRKTTVWVQPATRLPIHWKTDVAFILSVCVPADML